MAGLIIPVIMCGGAGTRLWPLSRESMPKQFAPLLGSASTLQEAIKRVIDPDLFAPPLVITHSDFRFIAAEQVRECGAKAEILLEPARRDSATAIAVATEFLSERTPTSTVLVLAADHMIADSASFRAACRAAMPIAMSGRIVTFGVQPTYPSTSYGYIRPGSMLDADTTFAVAAFVEKPDVATASRYMAEGYLWNSGNFVFRTDTMRDEIARFEPAIARAAKSAVLGATNDLDFIRLAAEPYRNAPKKSIDYAVMEHTGLAAVLPVDFEWSDIGTWDAVWALAARDPNGNAIDGPVEALDTRDSLIRSDGSLLAAVVGCENLVVVATSDAVLVVPRKRSDQVKLLLERLKSKNRSEATEHRKIFRPWGYFQGVDAGQRYQVKRIVVKPGQKLSLQKHHHRAEHWVVVKGTAEVTIGKEILMVHENESAYIPIGSVHRLANPGKIPLELVEVQVGSYLGEDDIIRIEDVYQRE